MECKSILTYQEWLNVGISIDPMWNVNGLDWDESRSGNERFNRSNVECKSLITRKAKENKDVSIDPMWNVNLVMFYTVSILHGFQ